MINFTHLNVKQAINFLDSIWLFINYIRYLGWAMKALVIKTMKKFVIYELFFKGSDSITIIYVIYEHNPQIPLTWELDSITIIYGTKSRKHGERIELYWRLFQTNFNSWVDVDEIKEDPYTVIIWSFIYDWFLI